MPKEVIEVTENGATNAVVVGWNRLGYVHVATLRPDGTDPSGATGQYVTVDRDQINQLIRNLRRARDIAFGRDE